MAAEHRHRYRWASRFVAGDVCDIACGNGYGASILCEASSVKSYVGIDVSAETITAAVQRFSGPQRQFKVGSAVQIPIDDQSIDAIVSLETLEHLQQPDNALNEYLRILRNDGILVGSVPSKYFDDLAEQVYGSNPYHVTRFTHTSLNDLLTRYFRTVRFYFSAVQVVSQIGECCNGVPPSSSTVHLDATSVGNEIEGSFHFVATNNVSHRIDAQHRSEVLVCQGLTSYHATVLAPLRKRIADSDSLVAIKDGSLQEAAALLAQKDADLRAASDLIRQRDEHLSEATEMIRKRDEHLAQAAEFIRLRDEHLAQAAEFIRVRDERLMQLESRVAQLSKSRL